MGSSSPRSALVDRSDRVAAAVHARDQRRRPRTAASAGCLPAGRSCAHCRAWGLAPDRGESTSTATRASRRVAGLSLLMVRAPRRCWRAHPRNACSKAVRVMHVSVNGEIAALPAPAAQRRLGDESAAKPPLRTCARRFSHARIQWRLLATPGWSSQPAICCGVHPAPPSEADVRAGLSGTPLPRHWVTRRSSRRFVTRGGVVSGRSAELAQSSRRSMRRGASSRPGTSLSRRTASRRGGSRPRH